MIWAAGDKEGGYCGGLESQNQGNRREGIMSDRRGVSNADRFSRRKDASGRNLCRMCGEPTLDKRQTFCGPRCLRDFFMLTDWRRVRQVVYARDGGICMKCGRRVSRKDFHVDHIVPLSQGGDEWDLANLELSCQECNLQKGCRREIEYVVIQADTGKQGG
jgi:5-methylcytosine-specific restriction endonuclease McrA